MHEAELSEELNKRALKAISKKSKFGEDVDLERYKEEGESLKKTEVSKADRKKLLDVGVQEKSRSGSYLQFDSSVLEERQLQGGIEVMNISRALKKYEWLKDYWWKAVAVNQDKFTAYSQLHRPMGYFIRALPHAKSEFPVQACLYIKKKGTVQSVHNLIIAEEGSKLDVITGCAVGEGTKDALHIGISEFFVKKNATVSFTMIHSWGENVIVRPRSTAIVEENGTFLSNYINMRKSGSTQMYPTSYCVGKNSTVRYNTILVAPEGSNIDVGSRTVLKAEGSKTEMISRVISTGGNAYVRGDIDGQAKNVRGHLECRGLILGDKGFVYSVPELRAGLKDLDLSHEAAIGKIAEEEIFYLMTKGLSEEEATAVIVRGFLNVDIRGLPPLLDKEIKRTIETSLSSML